MSECSSQALSLDQGALLPRAMPAVLHVATSFCTPDNRAGQTQCSFSCPADL